MYLIKLIIGIGMLGIIGLLIVFSIRYVKFSILELRENSKRHISKRKANRKLIKRIYKTIRKDNHNYTIFVLFEIFCNFYESNFFKEHDWDLTAWVDMFPEGKNDLTTIYKWINSVRDINIKESIEVGYNFATSMVSIYEHDYPDFKFTFDKYNQIHITPILEGEPLTYSDYKVKVEKMFKHLNDLDFKVSTWILERRQYFAI